MLDLLEKKETGQARNALKIMEKGALKDEQKGHVLYLQGLLALETDPSLGRELLKQVLKEHYSQRLAAKNKVYRLRVLAGERLAAFAGDRGYPQDVSWLEEIFGRDARTNWYNPVDSSGKPLGKTKMGDLFKFQKIRAYLKKGQTEEARKALKEAFLLKGKAATSQGIVDMAQEVRSLKTSLGEE